MNSSIHPLRSWSVTALAVAAVALLTGCQSTSPDASSASSSTSSVATSSAPAASTAAPPCPSGASLFPLAPEYAQGKDVDQVTPATCSGTWAVIGVHGPGAVQTAELFQYVQGSWRWVDRNQACTAGQVPPDLEQGVCNAG